MSDDGVIAKPGEGFENDSLGTCVHCHRGIKKVIGGRGRMWIHEDGWTACKRP